MQFGSGKPIDGYVDFFAADTDGGGNSGINHISLQLTLTGIQLGTMVNNGIGILRHGEPLSGEYSRLPSNYASDPSNLNASIQATLLYMVCHHMLEELVI